MRFKVWFAEYGGGLGAATSVMHGGLGDPVMTGNANMPYGVRSKTQTKDGRADWQDDPEDQQKVADFGFERRPLDKITTRERRSKRIDRSRPIPLRNPAPDIIY